MYIIYESEKEAIQRNEKATIDSNFKESTHCYAEIIKHKDVDKFALIIAKGFEHLFTKEEIESAKALSNDWFELKVNKDITKSEIIL